MGNDTLTIGLAALIVRSSNHLGKVPLIRSGSERRVLEDDLLLLDLVGCHNFAVARADSVRLQRASQVVEERRTQKLIK